MPSPALACPRCPHLPSPALACPRLPRPPRPEPRAPPREAARGPERGRGGGQASAGKAQNTLTRRWTGKRREGPNAKPQAAPVLRIGLSGRPTADVRVARQPDPDCSGARKAQSCHGDTGSNGEAVGRPCDDSGRDAERFEMLSPFQRLIAVDRHGFSHEPSSPLRLPGRRLCVCAFSRTPLRAHRHQTSLTCITLHNQSNVHYPPQHRRIHRHCRVGASLSITSLRAHVAPKD